MDAVDQPGRHGRRPLLRDQRLSDRHDSAERVPAVGDPSDQALLRAALPASDTGLYRRDDRRAVLRAQHPARSDPDGISALHERRQHVGEFPLCEQLPAGEPAVHGLVLVARDRGTVLSDPAGVHPRRHAVRPAAARPWRVDGAGGHHPMGRHRSPRFRPAVPRPAEYAVLGGPVQHRVRQPLHPVRSPAVGGDRRLPDGLPSRAGGALLFAHATRQQPRDRRGRDHHPDWLLCDVVAPLQRDSGCGAEALLLAPPRSVCHLGDVPRARRDACGRGRGAAAAAGPVVEGALSDRADLVLALSRARDVHAVAVPQDGTDVRSLARRSRHDGAGGSRSRWRCRLPGRPCCFCWWSGRRCARATCPRSGASRARGVSLEPPCPTTKTRPSPCREHCRSSSVFSPAHLRARVAASSGGVGAQIAHFTTLPAQLAWHASGSRQGRDWRG